MNPNPDLRVPAEWEPQSCIYLAWPHNRETWPDRFDAVPSFYARWVAIIADSTPVRVLAAAAVAKDCESKIGGIANAEIIDIPTNDCWIRDYGPTFVVNKSLNRIEAVNWQYNAWGGKYPPWDLDHAAATALCDHCSIDCVDSPLCLEGGAIELDGAGRLLATPDCVMTESRNPGWTMTRIEAELSSRLGAKEFCWLTGGGLQGDDTDGHIDQLARFIDRANIVAAICNDDSDPNHRPLEQNFLQLCEWAEATTPRMTVHRLPIPPARQIRGQRVPESYCNFLRLGPDRMLMPTFGATTDARAATILSELTGLKVEPIDCRELVWGLGALHCASRDQPLAAR
jgi:agmatine deiminase